MADVAKSGTPSPCDPLIPAPQRITAPAAAAVAAGDMLYLTSAGRLDLADGSAADALALHVGMACNAQPTVGEPVTAAWGTQFHYGAGMTPGARLYVSATAGALADAASTGGTVPAAIVISATRVFVLPPTR